MKMEIVVERDNSRVVLFRKVFDLDFEKLKEEIEWQGEKIFVFGKWHEPNRMRSGQGELSYSYSGTKVVAREWTPLVKSVKDFLESKYGADVNYVLLNYYPDGTSQLGYHSDDEKGLVFKASIWSVSFGASRKFYLKHSDGTLYKTVLNHGDLLVMEGETQLHFKHSVPKEAKVKEPRINMTFRLLEKE